MPLEDVVRTASRTVVASLLLGACAEPATPVATDPGPPLPVVEHVATQEILTPLPLRVGLPARYGAERVLVFVKTWGSRDWAVLELARAGQTWSGEVSCRDVSTVTGETKDFFVALDARGDTVVGSGSPEWPHAATIVRDLPGGARTLTGDVVPLRCHDPADCPPDFPGCPAYAVVRPGCATDADCSEGIACEWDGYCGPPPPEVVDVRPVDATDEELLAAAVRKVTRRYRMAATPSRVTR